MQVDEGVELVPPRVDEATVAAGRPAAADVLLDDHDPKLGRAALQLVCGPHSGVAATHDRDVAVDVARRAGQRSWVAFGLECVA